MSNNSVVDLSSCKRQKVAPNEQIDRISSLPDSILVHILSLLPTKDAVKMVHIRRFGNLWASIYNLDFDGCLYQSCQGLPSEEGPVSEKRLVNLIRHVLILHEHSDIHRFRLSLWFCLWFSTQPDFQDDHEMDMEGAIAKELKLANEIDTWIRFALRKKVKVLELDFKACGDFEPKSYHKLPNVVITSDFLAEMNLVCCHVGPRERIHMGSLKTLALKRILISDKTMIETLSGYPVLDRLFLIECYGLHKPNFTSVNLKNVTIELNHSESSRLEISCSYVTSLDILGIERLDLNNVPSIVDAAHLGGNYDCAHGEYHEVKMLFEKVHHL